MKEIKVDFSILGKYITKEVLEDIIFHNKTAKDFFPRLRKDLLFRIIVWWDARKLTKKLLKEFERKGIKVEKELIPKMVEVHKLMLAILYDDVDKQLRRLKLR